MIDFTKTKFLNFQNWNMFQTGARLMEFKLETNKGIFKMSPIVTTDDIFR